MTTKFYDELNTGDIILCHGDDNDSIFDKIIEECTHSPYEHAAIVIKDPWWLKNLKGIFVFQSNIGPNSYPDVLNETIKGVTLNKLEDFLSGRKWVCARSMVNINWDNTMKKKFKKLFYKSYNKSYDTNICHWLGTGIGSCCGCPCLSRYTNPKQTKEFWCSALVSYMYCKMEWCDKNID